MRLGAEGRGIVSRSEDFGLKRVTKILGGVKGGSAPYRRYIGVEAGEMKYKT